MRSRTVCQRSFFSAAAMAVWLGLVSGCGGTPPTEGMKAFVGARIMDGTGKAAIENATLVVRLGKVEAVGPSSLVPAPPAAERIDVAGKTIIPGLINTHGHVGDTQGLRSAPEFYTQKHVLDQLALYARYGVTTVFSLGGDGPLAIHIRNDQEPANLKRARLYFAGTVITGETPETARKLVDEVASLKADLIKIRVDDNLGTTKKMTPPVYQAVIEQAHKNGLRVAAHIFYLDDAKSLLDAGADFLAHSIRDRDVDDAIVQQLKQRDVCVCPTLTREVSTFVYETTPVFFEDPFFLRDADSQVLEQLRDPKRQQGIRDSKSAQRYKQALEIASRNLKKLSDAGVRIAFGTDTGPPARFQGYFEHMELELMTKAGLTPMQALTSATGDAARCMKVGGQLGTLAPGAAADFLVLGKNPLEDIQNTKTLESVWIAGNRVPAR